jgi:hypothetical protein
MTKNLLSNVHFQLRLVKELRGLPGGRRKIVTLPFLGRPKEGAKDDCTLRLYATERSALQAARNYCQRSDERKGLPAGLFLGVVVVKFESDPSGGSRLVRTTIPQRLIGGHSKPRERGTTTWLYYIEPESCKAFSVDTTISGEHLVGEEVK